MTSENNISSTASLLNNFLLKCEEENEAQNLSLMMALINSRMDGLEFQLKKILNSNTLIEEKINFYILKELLQSQSSIIDIEPSKKSEFTEQKNSSTYTKEIFLKLKQATSGKKRRNA